MMYNAEEARRKVEWKMRRYIDWTVHRISEDDNNYYFFFGVRDYNTLDPYFPVIRLNKCTGKVDALNIMKDDNFKVLCAARVFYHRTKGIDLSVEERAAIRRKHRNPDTLVLCPRCGKKLQYIREQNNIFVQCETMYCIYCSTREW